MPQGNSRHVDNLLRCSAGTSSHWHRFNSSTKRKRKVLGSRLFITIYLLWLPGGKEQRSGIRIKSRGVTISALQKQTFRLHTPCVACPTCRLSCWSLNFQTEILNQETFSSFLWSRTSPQCHVLNLIQMLKYRRIKEGKCQLVTSASIPLPPFSFTPPWQVPAQLTRGIMKLWVSSRRCRLRRALWTSDGRFRWMPCKHKQGVHKDAVLWYADRHRICKLCS